MRWDQSFFCDGNEFDKFWTTLAAASGSVRRGLLIAGRGFESPHNGGAGSAGAHGLSHRGMSANSANEPQDSPDRPRSTEAAANETVLRSLFKDSTFEVVEVPVRDATGRLVGSGHVQALHTDQGWLSGFTDIVVDITALPTSVSFPLLGMLITVYDELRSEMHIPFNLHCIVCENAEMDEHIVAEGGDVAEYIDPFRGRGGLAADPDPITIWAPVLGEGQAAALRKIYDMLGGPDEVKPFLPFPSLNPRRGDELVAEYHSLLFDAWKVEARGFIYADERDPFDIYRQLGALADDYSRALRPLATAKIVVSAHSSKLLSLGVLLAAFEHGIGVAHVEPTRYRLDASSVNHASNELFEVWLAGEAYVG